LLQANDAVWAGKTAYPKNDNGRDPVAAFFPGRGAARTSCDCGCADEQPCHEGTCRDPNCAIHVTLPIYYLRRTPGGAISSPLPLDNTKKCEIRSAPKSWFTRITQRLATLTL